MEYLNVQNVSFVGGCIVVIIWLVKYNAQVAEKQEEAIKDKFNYMEQSFREERERHMQEEKELKKEIKNLHNIQEERDVKFLSALSKNTEQLKNVADKLEIIPKLQLDVNNIQTDIKFIKEKIS